MGECICMRVCISILHVLRICATTGDNVFYYIRFKPFYKKVTKAISEINEPKSGQILFLAPPHFGK